MQQPSSIHRFRNSLFTGAAIFFALLLFLPFFAPTIPTDTTPTSEGTAIPIIMYHLILRDPARAGKYVISPDALESDLSWLKDRGYETVTAEDLIAHVYQGEPLPQKPVILTFDDGYTNNYTYAYPLLSKYDMRGVLSVIGALCDRYTALGDENPNYANLTWGRLRELSDSGVFEIQNHTYDLHRTDGARMGCKRIAGESIEGYQMVLSRDLLQNQEAIQQAIGSRPRAFVYPFGAISPESKAVVKAAGFLASFSCAEGISTIRPGDTEGLYLLKRKNRPAGISCDDFFSFLNTK